MRKLLVAFTAWSGICSALAAHVNSKGSEWSVVSKFQNLQEADRCRVAMSLKRGDEDIIVALESRPSTVDYEMRLLVPGDLGKLPWGDGNFSLNGAKQETDWVVAERSSRPGILIYKMKLTRSSIDSAGADPVLRLKNMPGPGDFRIVGLGEAMSLLDACSANLLESWGYSKSSQSLVAAFAKPKKSFSDYASPSDYPPSALAAHATGETHALVDVGVDGTPSNCRIKRSSGNREIDSATCKIILKRSRFHPAKDTQGIAVAAPYYATLTWEIARQ